MADWRRDLLWTSLLVAGMLLALARCLLPSGSGDTRLPASTIQQRIVLGSVEASGLRVESIPGVELRASQVRPAPQEASALAPSRQGILLEDVSVVWQRSAGDPELRARRALRDSGGGLRFEECLLGAQGSPQPRYHETLRWRDAHELVGEDCRVVASLPRTARGSGGE